MLRLESRSQFVAFLFYLGTFISFLGSMTFTICLIAFMLRAGFTLFDASLIVGVGRLVPIFTSTLIGHKTDTLPAKTTVFITEIGGAIGSLGILWSWHQGKSGYWFLFGFSLMRSVLLSFQTGSLARIVKHFGQDRYQSQSRHAVWLNQATQGTLFFAGILGWIAIRHLSFNWVTLFDAVTYLLNGVVLVLLPMGKLKQQEPAPAASGPSIFKKFKDLYHYNARPALLDAALALVMMGTASFTARLAGPKQDWFSLFLISYGLSVWVSGYLEKKSLVHRRSSSIWITLGLSYALLGLYPEKGPITWSFCFLKDLSYWLLFHRITSYIQMDTPSSVIGSVSHARSAQMTLILALGELAVGGWQTALPISLDGAWRGLVCLGVASLLSIKSFSMEYQYDRPAWTAPRKLESFS
jgi:MFS family permease